MKILIEGIKLKKALEFVDKKADLELFHTREEDDLYDIKVIGFDDLDYIIPIKENHASFVALSFFDTDGEVRHIFFELDEYIKFIVM